METPYRSAPGTWVLPSFEPAPGMGVLPVNAFLIESTQPALIDTGMMREAPDFMAVLRSLIDPHELRWIFLTHEEGDHIGALPELVSAAPNARIVLNWIAMSKLKASGLLPPMPRLHLINATQSIDLGDRSIVAVRPPLFDSPASLAYFDNKTRTLFSADTFGALIPEHAESLTDVPVERFVEGFGLFNRVNSPWVHLVDRPKFDISLARLKNLDVATVLSAHAPAVKGRIDWLLNKLAALPDLPEFVGPDQQALSDMLSRMGAAA